MKLLDVQGLVKHFPIRKGLLMREVGQVKAVDGVTFDLQKGETLGLVGESGCGKSTTGRCIMRLIEPTAGDVRLDGQPLGALDAATLRAKRREMQIIFQDPYASLNPRMTVGQTLTEPLMLHGLHTGRHRERVAEGLPSIIFGMQSFGEGLDLPGALCESVFITKLPFAPPDDPVGEARAEWLRAVGRDPFSELVVPATALRLAQWAGRAIRSEDDQAHVYCYDKRLPRTSYGQRLLAGLPAFTREHRPAP